MALDRAGSSSDLSRRRPDGYAIGGLRLPSVFGPGVQLARLWCRADVASRRAMVLLEIQELVGSHSPAGHLRTLWMDAGRFLRTIGPSACMARSVRHRDIESVSQPSRCV